MKTKLLTAGFALAWSVRAIGQELPPPPPPPPGVTPNAELPSSEPPSSEAPSSKTPLAMPSPPRPIPVERDRPERRAPRPRFDDRAFMLNAQLGLGSLTGFAGVLAGYEVHDRFELGVGVGAGSGGPAAAAYIHARPFLWYGRTREQLHAITVQVGYSVGEYRDFEHSLAVSDADRPVHHLNVVRWFQYDFGWEMLTASGFDARAAFGVAVATNGNEAYCTTAATGAAHTPCELQGVPTLAVSLGHAF